jgi:hypothetical protein
VGAGMVCGDVDVRHRVNWNELFFGSRSPSSALVYHHWLVIEIGGDEETIIARACKKTSSDLSPQIFKNQW